MFQFVGREERPIARILNAVKIDVKRNDVPLVGFVLADVDVVAHDGAELARPAEAQLDRRLRADAREVDSAMAGAADAVEAFVEGFGGEQGNGGRGTGD